MNVVGGGDAQLCDKRAISLFVREGICLIFHREPHAEGKLLNQNLSKKLNH